DRQLARRARAAQVLERALEVGPLREHRQGVRPAALVRAHDALHARTLAQPPRGGRAALELGDHADRRLEQGAPDTVLGLAPRVRLALPALRPLLRRQP